VAKFVDEFNLELGCSWKMSLTAGHYRHLLLRHIDPHQLNFPVDAHTDVDAPSPS
jgi:hypothetical protein